MVIRHHSEFVWCRFIRSKSPQLTLKFSLKGKHVLPRRLNHRGRISDFRFKKLLFQSIGQNYLQRQSLAKSDADVDLSDFRKRVDDVSDFDDDDSSRYDVKDAAKNDVGNGRGGKKEMKKKKRKKQGGEFL